MASIPKRDIPQYVRRCYQQWKSANVHIRSAENERLRFYVGDQWAPEELMKRKSGNRPAIVINKCKPAVDQIEGDIRQNPPGPQVHPVGPASDGDSADIIEGLIRFIEYDSSAKTAYSTAGKYLGASGYAVMELETAYSDDRSDEQKLLINSVEDPSTVFFDPTSRKANREDASWAGRIRQLSKNEYIAQFGDKRKVLQPRGVQSALGWIKDVATGSSDMALLDDWTGKGDGPFYVCEFSMMEIERVTSRLYSDRIWRYEDDLVPKGARPLPGDENTREVPKRKLRLYTVDAFETLADTDWLGTLHKWIPVLGPEIYIDGKLYRLSLISGALDPSKALNYCANTMIEIAGYMPKSPWLGPEGSFDNPRWETANSEYWAYLEYTPVHVVNPADPGQSTLAPPPQRNMWEAPIQWLLALKASFSDDIKAVTAIYDPSLGAQKGEQSGRAIEQLRSESSVGNFWAPDNLHRAIEVLYNQICVIAPKIYSSNRVISIVRPDSQHEIVEINREFPDGIDPATGKKGKTNNITLGQYICRVTAGPSFETRQQEALAIIMDFVKASPQSIAVPGVASKILRMIGDGNPQVEGMADLLEPQGANEDATPQQLGQQLQQEQHKTQVLTMIVQKLQEAIQAKLPEIEAKKWDTAIKALTSIRVAEINAGMDQAALDVKTLENITGMAHETAMQAADQEHQAGMAQQQQVAAQQAQASDQAHAAASQASDQQAAAEQAQPEGE